MEMKFALGKFSYQLFAGEAFSVFVAITAAPTWKTVETSAAKDHNAPATSLDKTASK